jgi:hypothetical protein
MSPVVSVGALIPPAREHFRTPRHPISAISTSSPLRSDTAAARPDRHARHHDRQGQRPDDRHHRRTPPQPAVRGGHTHPVGEGRAERTGQHVARPESEARQIRSSAPVTAAAVGPGPASRSPSRLTHASAEDFDDPEGGGGRPRRLRCERWCRCAAVTPIASEQWRWKPSQGCRFHWPQSWARTSLTSTSSPPTTGPGFDTVLTTL